MIPDVTHNMPAEQTALQQAQDIYDEAAADYDRLKLAYFGDDTEVTDGELADASIRKTLAEDSLHAERQAVAADAEALPY